MVEEPVFEISSLLCFQLFPFACFSTTKILLLISVHSYHGEGWRRSAAHGIQHGLGSRRQDAASSCPLLLVPPMLCEFYQALSPLWRSESCESPSKERGRFSFEGSGEGPSLVVLSSHCCSRRQVLLKSVESILQFKSSELQSCVSRCLLGLSAFVY